MSIVIKFEGIGKSYTISHEERERYTSLRDVIARNTKRLFSFTNPTNPRIHKSTKEEFWALKDITFEVNQGDRIGIIGRNGAGKSTLLKILSRITEPTTGSVKIKGRVASLLEVGTGFHPELTGSENIFLNGAILGMSRTEVKKKFDEIVDFAEIEKFLDTPVKRYSSGMYVRLAFAVAAHLEPEILVVDEVLAVGDAQFQKKCLGKMEDVSKYDGRTVLFVSHNMGVINQLCNKSILLERGQILGNDLTEKITYRYLKDDYNSPVITLDKLVGKPFYFKRMEILDDNNENINDIDVRKPFKIKLVYEVLEFLRDVEIAIRFKRFDDISVFTSVFSESLEENKMNKEKGTYECLIEIPEMFLMPGSYNISPAAFNFSAGIVYDSDRLKNILQFNILETGTHFAKYNQHQEIGMIIKKLKWEERVVG